jgi:pantoate--beta-alanine ligase
LIPTFTRVDDVRAWRAAERGAGRTVGLVPTMGGLHAGHLSLIDTARRDVDTVIISVFVNPTQFGPAEDLDAYPRDLDTDLALSAARGAEALFAPSVPEMYPSPQTVWIDPGPLAERLCGLSRPGHFRGMLTVVAKLLGIVEPEAAVFGRKDFQQSVLVGRMVAELGFGTRFLVSPTIRDPDGLALSSRNAYLTPGERDRALTLSSALRRARARFAQGERDPGRLARAGRELLEETGIEVEYVEIVRAGTLVTPETAEPAHVCAVAARVGSTRLIDNETLGEPSALDGLPADGGDG